MNKNLNDLHAKPDYKLLDHLLDVGYIAESLMKYGRAFTMAKSIAGTTNIDFDKVVSSVAWLCALHDIGKAHPYFITNMYLNSKNELLTESYNNLVDEGLIFGDTEEGFRHERFSREILKKYFKDNNYPIESNDFADLVAYHHQGKSLNDFSDKIKLSDEKWINIHNEIIDTISEIWSFDKTFSSNTNFINGVNYSILSIMVTADWIASGSKWRELIISYPDKAECAKKFIEDNELLYVPMSERFKNLTWENTFNFLPNNMQSKCIDVAKTIPSLMIVEYPCGGGKTEAALSAAVNMGTDKTGIYIATPTMSTAKGMALRMNELANKIDLGLNILEMDSSVLWSDEDMNKIPNELWVSKSRHKLLYPFAVGTVDQILKTMLSYRYSCIGLMGLSDKVLIVDEIHAYDTYMLKEIEQLLKWAKFLDIPVILLSATLPTITKEKLLKAAGCPKNELNLSNEYPLITTYGQNGCESFPISCTSKKFKLNILEVDDYDAAWNIELSKDYDGCTAYIEDTVDNAWSLFRKAQNLELNPILFTGRDTLAQKEEKTKLLIKLLGKDRANRPKKLTVVATSIIEQSLDIDVDRMITALAPIDLLIQRFGRVWRHNDAGTIREFNPINTQITIIIPKNISNLPKIYNPDVLKKTIEVLKNMSEIDTVKDARKLIDAVYNDISIINDSVELIRASYNCIEAPNKDAMFDNSSNKYQEFSPIQSATRYETYPTDSMAIVDLTEIKNIETDPNIIKKIMRNNVVNVAHYKIKKIQHVTPQQFSHKLINDVLFFNKNELAEEGIELTKDGLKWSNN